MRNITLALGFAVITLFACSPASAPAAQPQALPNQAGATAGVPSGNPTAGSNVLPPTSGPVSLPTAGSAAMSGSQSAPTGGMSSAGRTGGASGRTTVPTAGAAGSCSQDIRCKLAAMPSTGDPKQDCVDRINQFRTQCACLPPLTRWTDGEACADQMAMYDSDGRPAHSGFMANLCKGGNAQNECPGWPSEAMVVGGCLQSMWDEGPPPTSPCTDTCFQTYGHFINMTNTKLKKVACGFFKTAAGKFWAVQNFSP